MNKEPGLLYEFALSDPTGTDDFYINMQAEKDANEWLQRHDAVMHALIRDREETLPNGVIKVHYKLYGFYLQ